LGSIDVGEKALTLHPAAPTPNLEAGLDIFVLHIDSRLTADYTQPKSIVQDSNLSEFPKYRVAVSFFLTFGGK
jgi:hypothetical protein